MGAGAAVTRARHPPPIDADPVTAAPPTSDPPDLGQRFPIVGVGCSAGGLEALEQFFSHLPVDCGMAIVVIQHLLPQHRSALPELLQRFTRMPVIQVLADTLVQPGRVYVIAPDQDLVLRNGVLLPSARLAPAAWHLPIDLFLGSLAEDRHAQAIGVVLSGMGSDGTAGLAAIRAQGGFSLVQDPASAQAAGMPTSAIRARVADIVAAPANLPGLLADLLLHPAQAHAASLAVDPAPTDALDRILTLLHTSSGNDFAQYKPNTLLRRLDRRMAVRQVPDLQGYADLISQDAAELALLFQELLIGVTSFFRDPEVWAVLRDTVLPALVARHPAGQPLRAWVTACSTGEEAYSLAMVLAEVLAQTRPHDRIAVQIFATDLDAEAINVARLGTYRAQIAEVVSADRLARFFHQEPDGRYRVQRALRETVVFATQNLASDPPITRLNFLSCRNLLIYFGANLQGKMVSLFHHALQPGGVLLLGTAETPGDAARLFQPVDSKARIYQRSGQLSLPPPIQPMRHPMPKPTTAAATLAPHAGDTLGTLTDQLIQQTWAPPAVLVNSDGDILYISGRTGKYLEPAAGQTNINVHAMARAGLREALAGMVHKALREQAPTVLRGLHVGTNGGTQIIDLTVQPIAQPAQLRGCVLLVFQDVAAPPRRRRRSVAGAADDTLAQELQQARMQLQEAHAAMQATVEQLRSSNEELQSTNEELQSTNEELTTSKEELQSLNEELQSVNTELQSKVDDLTDVRNDMANLLNSTEIATLFLDNALNVRRFTSHALRLFRLIQGDVGRPLAHVSTDLDHPHLVADAQEVLRTLVFKESEAATTDGRWFRVRVMPYRTLDDLIAGVVITFTDITAIKLLEAELRRSQP